MLEFDEETHTYTLNGEKIPSVTQVLDHLGGYEGIPQSVLDVAAERGSWVHRYCEFVDYGELGEVEPDLQGYVDAYQSFLEQFDLELMFSESRVCSPKLKVAGTLDRVYAWKKVVKRERVVLADIKTTAQFMPAVGPQTAAYEKMLDEPVDERWCVRLKPDGTFERTTLRDKSDWQTFLACLTVHKWRAKHGRR